MAEYPLKIAVDLSKLRIAVFLNNAVYAAPTEFRGWHSDWLTTLRYGGMLGRDDESGIEPDTDIGWLDEESGHFISVEGIAWSSPTIFDIRAKGSLLTPEELAAAPDYLMYPCEVMDERHFRPLAWVLSPTSPSPEPRTFLYL